MNSSFSDIRFEIEQHNEDALILDGFDDAIVGIVEIFGKPSVVCYDKAQCIEIIQDFCGGSREEAEEYFEYNILGGYLGEATPVFLTRLDTI